MRGIVLAIDYGLARVGVARSDETRTAIEPVRTFSRSGDRRLAEEIAVYAESAGVVEIVIGMPLRDDPKVSVVQEGARRLRKHLGRIGSWPISFVDETLSSREGEEEGRRRGFGAARIAAELDQLAAVVILGRFLREGATCAD